MNLTRKYESHRNPQSRVRRLTVAAVIVIGVATAVVFGVARQRGDGALSAIVYMYIRSRQRRLERVDLNGRGATAAQS
jgi:hypothetical protein